MTKFSAAGLKAEIENRSRLADLAESRGRDREATRHRKARQKALTLLRRWHPAEAGEVG